jgi:hypothetical protein
MLSSEAITYPYLFIFNEKTQILFWVSSADGDYFRTTHDNLLYTASNLEDAKLKHPPLNKTYEKLFYENNLETITPKGCRYSPMWDDSELIILKENLSYVWHEITKKIKPNLGQTRKMKCV